MEYCFLNGEIIPLKEASLGLDDMGVLRGYGAFEFLRAYNGNPFLFKEHMNRFERSAHLLSLKLPLSHDKIKDIIEHLIEKNGKKDVNIRMVLTGGKATNGIEFDPENPTFFILLEEVVSISQASLEKGVKLVSLEHQRKLPSAKTTDYILPVKERKRMKEEGATEILYTSDGVILECSTSNFFLIDEGKVITPAKNILMGTTRKFILNIARDFFDVEERDQIEIEKLESAQEAFITATNKEILPVICVDDTIIGNGKVGSVTSFLMRKFKERLQHGF